MGEDVTEWLFQFEAEAETGDEEEEEDDEEDSEEDSEDDDEEGVQNNWHKLKEAKNIERY